MFELQAPPENSMSNRVRWERTTWWKQMYTTQHLKENPSHSFQWKILCSEKCYLKRKIIEGLIIQQKCPTLKKTGFIAFKFIALLLSCSFRENYKMMCNNGWL